LTARLLNVFAIPSYVFAEVSVCRNSIANWFVPTLISTAAGILMAMVLFSQPVILQRIHTQYDQLKKDYEEGVKSGQITRQAADKAEQALDIIARPASLKIIGSVGAVVQSVGSVFFWALVVWFLGRRYLRVRFPYMKAVEVAGLATMISTLGMVVKLLVIVNVSKMFSTQNLGLAVSDFNPDNPNYLLLVVINIFQFWFVALLAVGLSRLAGVVFPRALFLLATVWLLRAALLVVIGLGALVL
jgi:hypothetical protein